MTGSRQDYVYADQMLTRAVAAMLTEPSLHEGLLRAERRYLRSLDIDVDLPEHLRPRFRAWREKIHGGNHPNANDQQLLRGLRSLPIEQARRHAMALIRIANETAALR